MIIEGDPLNTEVIDVDQGTAGEMDGPSEVDTALHKPSRYSTSRFLDCSKCLFFASPAFFWGKRGGALI